jgi:hypothetical protein
MQEVAGRESGLQVNLPCYMTFCPGAFYCLFANPYGIGGLLDGIDFAIAQGKRLN